MLQELIQTDESDSDFGYAYRVFDNEDILLELDGSNNITSRYTHGPGIDEPLVMERAGQSFFYHADGLGSITDITDATGAIKQRYTYSSFGKIESQLDPSFVQPYTFTAREFDPETGLYHYRTRYYDPLSGRFISEDPIRFMGGINFYAMVYNSPTNWVDPWGLWTTAGHQGLTTTAMKRAGFSEGDIAIANAANRYVDRISNQLNNPDHYMPGTGPLAERIIEQRLNEAVERALEGDRIRAIEALGAGLHTVQDKWSHQIQNAGWKQHNPLDRRNYTDPDNPQRHPSEYADALRDSEAFVRRFLRRVGAFCPLN